MGVDVDAAPAVEHGVRRGLAAHGRSVSAKEGVIYRSNAHAASLHPRSRAGGMAAAPSAESQAKETKDDGQVKPYGACGGASLSPGADSSKECFDGSGGKGLLATAYDEHSKTMRDGAGAPGGDGGARGAVQAEGMADFRTWLEDQIRFSESLSMMSAAMAGSSSKTAGSVPRTRSAAVVSLARLPSLPLSSHAAGSTAAAAASPAADGASASDSALPVSGPLLPPNAVVPLTLGSASGASSGGSGGGGMLLSRFSPLRALARVAARRSRCCFSMHVHGISGLPPAFNRPPSGAAKNGGGGGGGWEAVVTWQRRGMAVGTSFAEVNEGVVKFEQMLQLSCTLYFSSGPSSTLRFQGKPSTVVVRVLDRTGGGAGGRSAGAGAGGVAEGRIGSSYEIGRHLVDLSRLVPQSLVETEIGPHTLSFPLDGPAKGAVLLATFGYELQINQHSGGGGSGRYGEARVARAETRAFRAFSLPSSARTSPSSSPSRSSGWAGATTATSSSSAAWEARSGGGEWGMEEGQGETPGVEEGPEATSLEREGEVGVGAGEVYAGGEGEVEAESAVVKGGGDEGGERAEGGGEVESLVVREGWGATEDERAGIEGEGVGRDKGGKGGVGVSGGGEGRGVSEEGALDVSGSGGSGRDAGNNEAQDDTIMDVIELEDLVAIESSEGAESPFTARAPALSSADTAADSSLSASHAGVTSAGAGGAEEEEGAGVLEEEMEAVSDEFLALLLDGQLSPEREGDKPGRSSGSRSSSSLKGAASSGAVSGAAAAGGVAGGGGLVLASSTLSHSGMLTVGNNGLWLDKIPEEEEEGERQFPVSLLP
ncbi:unnamed protein product [Closterium sp. Naga37s-1]|nr:unnamed protein product [Closterium sp. Naga37s-1]